MVARQDPREAIYNYNGADYFGAPAELGLMTLVMQMLLVQQMPPTSHSGS